MMKGFAVGVLCCGLLCGVASGQKSRYSSSSPSQVSIDYPVMVHVTLARVSVGADTASSRLHLDTLIGGQKVEMETSAGALIHPGDYRARMVKDDEKKSGWFTKAYELVFTDGTHVVFNVTAESE